VAIAIHHDPGHTPCGCNIHEYRYSGIQKFCSVCGDCTNCDGRRCMSCVCREYHERCAEDCPVCCKRAYRVLVTGSRNWPYPTMIYEALNDELGIAAARGYTEFVVVHGACPTGADAAASYWTQFPNNWPDVSVIEEPHPANWRPNGVKDLAAGFKRNAEMVSLGANACFGFIGACTKPNCKPWTHGSHGASHCADLAVASGITVRRWVL